MSKKGIHNTFIMCSKIIILYFNLLSTLSEERQNLVDVETQFGHRDCKFYSIPLEDHLLLIGDNILFQYDYSENGLNLMSEFSLN